MIPSSLPGASRELSSRAASPTRWLLTILLAIPLIVLNCYWIANSEMKTGVTEITISSLFLGVTFILFVVTMLNLVTRWLFPRIGLHQGEMLVLYVMLSISSVVAGVGNYGFFLPFLSHLFFDATPSNRLERFYPLLPSWFGPRDKDTILKPFYEGHSSMFHLVFIQAWAKPLIIWGFFFLVLVWTMLCMAAILRRQWADNEHLSFPVIYLPVEMTRTDGAFYRNHLLWLGFAVPFVIQSMNSLNSIFPSVPCWQINRLQSLGDFFRNRPWNGIDAMPYAVHPAGVGLGFLVSTDMLFSTWLFYVLFKLLCVFGVAAGWRDPAQGWFGLNEPRFPWFGYQGWGAWLALSLIALWLARPYLKAFVCKAWTGDYTQADRDEALTPRMALVGLACGLVFLCGFGSWIGFPLPLCMVFLTIYFLLMLALARIRASAGVPSTELVWVNPQQMLAGVMGSSAFSHEQLNGIAMYSWFNTDYRATPLCHEIEAFKASRMVGIRLQPVVVCIMVAALVAVIAASCSDLQLYYQNGLGTAKVNGWRRWKGMEPWNNVDNWWNNPRPADPAAILAMVAGAAITILLTYMRTQWMGFPLHPAAYVLNTSFVMEFFWLDFIVAWICKTFVLRYGGMKAYRSALPFFLGLILGDFVTGSGWSIVGVLLNLDLYRTFAT